MSLNKTNERIDAVRSFNRFYTREIGVITEQLLETPYSLPQARILFELARNRGLTATRLAEILRLDIGYLSRLLTSLEKSGLLQRGPSKTDGRQKILILSDNGKKVFSMLNRRSRNQVKSMLDSLSEKNKIRLLKAMSTIQDILDPQAVAAHPVVLRSHRSGDIGWIIQRHGILYNEEYQFDQTFEALVADILAKFIRTYNDKKDHLWIAEMDGERAGTILVADAGQSVAQLRLFLTEPWARNRGIGALLITECLNFARQAGYKKMKLWTQNVLHAARHLYEKAGFKMVKEEPHTSFGRNLVAETWEIEL